MELQVNIPANNIKTASTSSSGSAKLKQSPVDLTDKSGTWRDIFPPLSILNYSLIDGSAVMTNTGRTVKIELVGRKARCVMFGGPLKKDDYYQFSELQFRWGENNRRGSEHSINRLWFSMEAQAIHWNTRYKSMEKCYQNSDGIAILSYLIQADCPDTDLFDIVENLQQIELPGTSTLIPSDCLQWLSTGKSPLAYYTYEGSFTTPPYTECVRWIVMATPIKVSPRQIAAFRKLTYDDPSFVLSNCRSQYALNGRKITLHKDSVWSVTKGTSPIDLKDYHVKGKKFAPLILNGHWLDDDDAYLFNNGKTAVIQLNDNVALPTVSGGPLLHDVYEFVNAHFHWGKEDCNGSEHQINGTWFSMEGHVVHRNKKYETYKECLNESDGIAILSYFFLVTKENCDDGNSQIEKITDYLKNIVTAGAKTEIPKKPLCWMRDAINCSKYYTYRGSYNKGEEWNPECATWIVFPLMIPISSRQLAEFRKLRDHKNAEIMGNCKTLRPTIQRKIFLVADKENETIQPPL